MAAVTFKEYSLAGRQHARGDADRCSSRAWSTAFPLNDQEILCRHLHKDGRRLGRRLRARTRGGGPMSDGLLPRAVRRARAVRRRRGACATEARALSRERLASTMDEMQTFYDAFSPRAEEAIAYCEKFPLDDLPDDAERTCCSCCTRSSWCRSRWRRGASRSVPDSGAAYLDLPDRAACRERRRSSSRADRWVDIDAGEVRSPAVDRRRGRPHRGGRTRRELPSARRPRSTSATSRCCPASWTWSSTCSSAVRSGGNPRHDVQDDPAFRTLRGTLNCRTTLLAGFTTARNLGLVREDRRLPARRRAAARDRQRLDRRPAPRPRRARDHARPAATSTRRCSSGSAPDIMPLSVEEGIANGVPEVRKAVRYQIKYGAGSSRSPRPAA